MTRRGLGKNCRRWVALNGYRVKEKMPSNIGEFRVPLGKVEVT